jgi:hypothetical protein
VGAADRAPVRGGHLACFSAHADARHCGSVEKREGWRK